MRFRKEIQIFKEVYQHSLFGDHVQEVRMRARKGRGHVHHPTSNRLDVLHVVASRI